jgi:uncharacterized protein (DUF4415 family)
VDALTDDEIEAAVRDDPDAPPIVDQEWFASATLVMPESKEQISIRLDRDELEHFRQYPRYQTRINAILRAAMEHEKKIGDPRLPFEAPKITGPSAARRQP